MAITIEPSACELERAFLASRKLPAGELKAMAGELAGLGALPSMADSLDRGERCFARDALQVLARQGPYRAGQLLSSMMSASEWQHGPSALFLFVPTPYEAAMRRVVSADLQARLVADGGVEGAGAEGRSRYLHEPI